MNINQMIERAEKTGYYLSKFLCAEDIEKLKLIKRTDLKVYLFGGYEDAERARVIIQDESYLKPGNDDFSISLLKLSIPMIDEKINHRHILGNILSLGIKREVLGDILIDKNNYYLFTTSDIVNFLKTNITRINEHLVEIEEISFDELTYQKNIKSKELIVSSMRIDAIISKALNISREKAKEIVDKQLVQVNHLTTIHPEKEIKINDLISIRHFGRIKYVERRRMTKANHIVILVEISH